MRWSSTALYIPLFTQFHSAWQSTVPIIPLSSTFYFHNISLSTRHVIVHSTAHEVYCRCHSVTFQGIILLFNRHHFLSKIIYDRSFSSRCIQKYRDGTEDGGALFELPYLGNNLLLHSGKTLAFFLCSVQITNHVIAWAPSFCLST